MTIVAYMWFHHRKSMYSLLAMNKL